MEARAHHVIIGLFTVIIVVAGMCFSLWLATGSAGRETAHYDVIFSEPVTGLSEGNSVQYSGVRVGEVETLTLDAADPSKVRARISVATDTPIRRDTVARLAITGVTGISIIQLSGGSPGSPRLQPSDSNVPVIVASPSSLERLASGGQDVMVNVNASLRAIQALLSDRNLAHISTTLDSLAQTTQSLANQRDAIRVLIATSTQTARDADAAVLSTKALADQGRVLLDRHGEHIFTNLERTTSSLATASDTMNRTLSTNEAAIRASADGAAELQPTLESLQQTLKSLREVTTRLDKDPPGYLLNRDTPREFAP